MGRPWPLYSVWGRPGVELGRKLGIQTDPGSGSVVRLAGLFLRGGSTADIGGSTAEGPGGSTADIGGSNAGNRTGIAPGGSTASTSGVVPLMTFSSGDARACLYSLAHP